MPCIATGTLVLTTRGEVPAEQLRPGDMIVTRDHGPRPLRRVMVKSMSGRFLLDNPHLKPVLIRKGAFGDGLPTRDTMISPNMRIPLTVEQGGTLRRKAETMTAVKHLIDHDGVRQIDTVGIGYVHLGFDRHEVIAVNGFWAENFECTDRSLGVEGNAQRNEIAEIFPDERQRDMAMNGAHRRRVVDPRALSELL